MREARGSKLVATAQSRGARHARERIMPKKLKSEPKVDEPGKPYEATPAEKEAVRRVLARREGRSSAPRVSIRHEGETEVISLTQGDPVAAGVARFETSLKRLKCANSGRSLTWVTALESFAQRPHSSPRKGRSYCCSRSFVRYQRLATSPGTNDRAEAPCSRM